MWMYVTHLCVSVVSICMRSLIGQTISPKLKSQHRPLPMDTAILYNYQIPALFVPTPVAHIGRLTSTTAALENFSRVSSSHHITSHHDTSGNDCLLINDTYDIVSGTIRHKSVLGTRCCCCYTSIYLIHCFICHGIMITIYDGV
jgi:hypothetical protein